VGQAERVPARLANPQLTGSGDAVWARMTSVVIFIFASLRVAEPGLTGAGEYTREWGPSSTIYIMTLSNA
jgi:hypothetical protein